MYVYVMETSFFKSKVKDKQEKGKQRKTEERLKKGCITPASSILENVGDPVHKPHFFLHRRRG